MTEAWATVVVGLLSFLGTMTGVIHANRKTQALVVYRLEQLEKKVDTHNHVIERTYKLEEQTAIQEEQIKVANKRIADLERHEEARIKA